MAQFVVLISQRQAEWRGIQGSRGEIVRAGWWLGGETVAPTATQASGERVEASEDKCGFLNAFSVSLHPPRDLSDSFSDSDLRRISKGKSNGVSRYPCKLPIVTPPQDSAVPRECKLRRGENWAQPGHLLAKDRACHGNHGSGGNQNLHPPAPHPRLLRNAGLT